MKIPVLDLKPQIAAHREAIMEAVESIIDSASFVLGSTVAELEEAVAAHTGSDHAIGVASGSDALLIALMALGIGNDDCVITTPYTFFATVGAICRLDAVPAYERTHSTSMRICLPTILRTAVKPIPQPVSPATKRRGGSCAP